MLTDEDYLEWATEQDWTFAKTYAADNPHEYITRHDVPEGAFEAFVLHIRITGYREEFEGYMYTVKDLGDHKYWTMGDPIPETIVLNRKHHDGYDPEQELIDMGEDPEEWL